MVHSKQSLKSTIVHPLGSSTLSSFLLDDRCAPQQNLSNSIYKSKNRKGKPHVTKQYGQLYHSYRS